jgi:hypothetical protein
MERAYRSDTRSTGRASETTPSAPCCTIKDGADFFFFFPFWRTAQFKVHLESFLREKGLKKRGEYMIRFVGEQGGFSSTFVVHGDWRICLSFCWDASKASGEGRQMKRGREGASATGAVTPHHFCSSVSGCSRGCQDTREKMYPSESLLMYSLRFRTDVHSPFVHLYTTSLPSNHLTVKVYPSDSDPSHSESFTLWTHLRTINGTSHWSCRAPKFWPLRVVLAGPNEDDIIPPAPRKPLKKKGGDDHDDGDDRGDPEVKANTKENSKIVVADPTNEVIADPVPALQIPTILASVKQLGVAVAKSIPPGVQTSIQTQFVALKSSWTAAWAPKPAPEEEYESEDSEERRARRRERRRARREKEEYEAREAKEDRRRERRRLRSQTMG